MIRPRFTVELNQPTRNKDREIHLLTNLPSSVEGQKIAGGYHGRWSIEVAFAKLTTALRCELDTLGYPDAALFGFCLAVVMYNAVSTVMAAIRAAHPTLLQRPPRQPANVHGRPKMANRTAKKDPPRLSFDYLADEIAGVWRGMAIAVPSPQWRAAFAKQTPSQLAKLLLWLARKTHVDRFLTNPDRPQQRRKRRLMTTTGGHVSTYRLLQNRKPTSDHR
jgi:hypothetical protein